MKQRLAEREAERELREQAWRDEQAAKVGFPGWLTAVHSFVRWGASTGHHVELHADSQGLRDFFAMIHGASVEWDGSDPLRSPS